MLRFRSSRRHVSFFYSTNVSSSLYSAPALGAWQLHGRSVESEARRSATPTVAYCGSPADHTHYVDPIQAPSHLCANIGRAACHPDSAYVVVGTAREYGRGVPVVVYHWTQISNSYSSSYGGCYRRPLPAAAEPVVGHIPHAVSSGGAIRGYP